MNKNEAKTLLDTHTNKITKSPNVVQEIMDASPAGISYVNIKHRLYHIMTGLTSAPTCANDDCEEHVMWDHRNQRYPTTCGYTCSNKITASRTLNKRMNTNTKRYGGNAPACDPTVVQARHNTCEKRYGPDYNKAIHQKAKRTLQTQYGVENVSQLHISNDTRDKLNTPQYLIQEHLTKRQPLQKIAADLQVSDTTVNRFMKNQGIEIKRFYNSSGELELRQFFSDMGVTFTTNTKELIPPQEIDIYLPDFKIAIEFNGVYWHSERAGKTRLYHLSKTEQCEAQGVRLIQIFEDEWRDDKQKCIDTLIHLIGKSNRGIGARETVIREIPWKQAKAFLNTHHLLHAGTAGNYRIGAFGPNDELIGVMVFGHQNNENSNPDAIELKRFVTNKNNNPGLGSKMFHYAIKQKQYQEVIAFVDRRWFTGLVKDHIGFKRVGVVPPTVWWTDGRKRYHRRFITKKKLNDMGLDPQVSKRQVLHQLGYFRIWDCGKYKLKWERSI